MFLVAVIRSSYLELKEGNTVFKINKLLDK